MCVIELEPCEVWREKIVTARRDHLCSCCGGVIALGEKYTRHFSVFEGEPNVEKMCIACQEIADAFKEEHGTRSNPSSMSDLLSDCIADDSPGSDRWEKALDEMTARRAARKAAS